MLPVLLRLPQEPTIFDLEFNQSGFSEMNSYHITQMPQSFLLNRFLVSQHDQQGPLCLAFPFFLASFLMFPAKHFKFQWYQSLAALCTQGNMFVFPLCLLPKVLSPPDPLLYPFSPLQIYHSLPKIVQVIESFLWSIQSRLGVLQHFLNHFFFKSLMSAQCLAFSKCGNKISWTWAFFYDSHHFPLRN